VADATGRSRPRRTRRALLAVALIVMAAPVLAVVLGSFGPARADVAPAPTAAPGTTAPGSPLPVIPATPGQAVAPIDIVDLYTSSGLIDPVLARGLSDSITRANQTDRTCASGDAGPVACRAIALVWQMDTDGVVIPDAELVALMAQMRASGVPVDIWVGPSGAQLTGTAALLVGSASTVGMAPGTKLGLDGHVVPSQLTVVASQRNVPTGLISAQEGQDQGLTKAPAPTLGDFAVNIPGFQVKEITQNGETRREPVTVVQFSTLPLLAQLMHTVASPPVAYLLFTIGTALLVFELFTAGVGVAGVVGATMFVLSCYGLAVLPTHWWAIALLVLGMVAFAVDVQTGVPRFWTAAGVALYIVGSLTLYVGVSTGWIAFGAGIVGILLAFLSGMPSMVRTRFSTPTIGREWMIGELGRAVTAIAPDGVVQIKGALWRAYTNRATPVEELDRVRVIGIEGLVLEVEPEEGAARDYRDRSPRDAETAAAEPANGAPANGTPAGDLPATDDSAN
jgi:membrane-bound serine protease (ClpP class)